jgi:acetylornithine deacetylase/succinyl-diaminopimelate desuccinylase-like protein
VNDIFAHIEAHRAEYLARLMAYVSRPSISAHGVGIAETAEWLLGELQALGMAARLVETPGWPVVVGRRMDHLGAPTVLLYGHYDVQPPDPLEAWDSPPFVPEIRNGRMYGRGVGDNKGQHLAQLLAIEATLAVRGKLPCNVVVMLEGEEEVGSPHLAQIVVAERELLACDLVVTADGPLPEDGRPAIHFGVRGVLSFELRARGAKRDLHSGNFGGIAPNPLWTLVHLLGTMKNEQGEITIAGFYDAVQPASALELAALQALPADVARMLRELELARLDAPADRLLNDRLALWPTLTINGLHGGYGGPGSKTVLPHEAFAKCDMRLVADQTVEDVFAKVQAHIRQHAPEVEVIFQGGMDPSKTPLDSPFATPIRDAIREAQGVEPLLVPALGGSLPDYVWTKILGVPAFVTPYANHDETNHAPNENLEVERFIAGIKTGAALLANVGKVSPEGQER